MNQRAQRLTGFEENWLPCFQFDRAVGAYGRYIENMSMKRDETTHKLMYSMEMLLGIRQYVKVTSTGIQVDED